MLENLSFLTAVVGGSSGVFAIILSISKGGNDRLALLIHGYGALITASILLLK